MTITRQRLLAILTLLLGVALTSASPQTPGDMQLLKSIEASIYTGQCEEAVDALRNLAKLYPRNIQIYSALKNALICDKQLDSALLVLDYLVKLTPDPTLRFTHYLDITSVYLKQGDTKKAEQQIQTALAIAPGNPQAYEQAANAYMGNGYYPDAVKLLLDGRKKFGDPMLYAKSLGQLSEIMRSYGDAAREYYAMLAHDTTSEVFVTGKISQLIALDSEEDYDTGLKNALADIVKQNPKSKDAHRYFGDLLMSQGKLDDAFQRFRLADSLGNGAGKDILYFATVARDNGSHAAVEKSCNYLIARYPQSPFRIASRFILADSYFDDRRFADAIAVYDQIAKQSLSDRDISEAFYAMGFTELHGLHNVAAALTLFERLMKDHPATTASILAKIAAADCHLALGQPQLADSLYAAVPLKLLQQKNQEELLHRQAELWFYLGNFQQAREAYGKMMNTFPKSTYVNDCLRRVMLISEYPGMDEATLRLYAEAAYAKYRFDYDSALVLLGRLKDHEGGGSLSEIAWYDAGDIELELGKNEAALIQFDSLISQFPASFYTPLAIERKGDVYAEVSRDCLPAKSMYEAVLLKYPTSLNLEAVRKKLQRVERLLCTHPDKPKS